MLSFIYMTDIELIKSKLDIVDIVGSYLPDMKRAGNNYKARCPFHGEKTPSFMVNPALQIYKCFGCGKGGDVINFLQEIEGLEFSEALKLSAEKAHVELTQHISQVSKKEEEEKKKIIEANTLAAKFFHYLLTNHQSGKKGRDYATKRGMNAEVIKEFLMGYAPNSKENLKKFLLKKGFNEVDLIRWGLLVERTEGYSNKKVIIDKFRNRLIHPIFNIKGEVIGFSGRYIGQSDNAPKYLNSPETIVFKKNEQLYGLFQARESMRQSKFVIIEEGNVDILSSHRVGIGNIVAPLGTAFTENQAKLLKRYVDEFYFCFDTDKAGINALIKSIGIAENMGVQHKTIDVSPYKDPDELIMKEPKGWENRVSNPLNSLDYLINVFSKECDLSSVDGKIKFSGKIIPVLRLIKDEITLSHFEKKISIILEVSEDVVRTKVKGEKLPLYRTKEKEDSGVPAQANSLNRDAMFEKYFIGLLVASDSIKKTQITDAAFTNDDLRTIFNKLLNSRATDPADIFDELSDPQKELFEDIMVFDITSIDNVGREIEISEKKLREKQLKRDIMRLRRQIAGSQDVDSMQKLQDLLNELKKLN